MQKVTGQTLLDYLWPRLFEPLGILEVDWEKNPQDICTGGWGLQCSTPDMARIGSLLMKHGKWKGKRILPRKWINQMTTYQTDSCPKDVSYEDLPQSGLNLRKNDWIQGFGYQVWLCRKKNVFRSEATSGQIIVVCNEPDAVIAINAETENLKSELNLIYYHLLPALPEWKGRIENGNTITRIHHVHYSKSFNAN